MFSGVPNGPLRLSPPQVHAAVHNSGDNQLLRFRFLGEGHSIGRQKQGAKHHGGTGGQLSKWIHIPTLNQRKAAKTRPKM